MDIMFTSLLGSAVFLALIFFREFFLWLRNNIPKSVQCWFCHAKTKVEYRFANNWYCSNCNQYNGFTKDGGYNTIIDNHYEEKFNFTITSVGRTKDAWKSTKRLCEKCNRNQELKVQQLASFVPLNEKNYDIEIEHYRTASSYTPPYEENLVSQAYQKGNRIIPNNTKSAPPPPSPPKTPVTTTNIIKPQRNWTDSINTGIRGLSLGNNAANVNGFKNCSRRDDAWWVNSGNSKQKRTSQRNTTQFGFNSNRPPSTPSSGFSDVDDIVDDNGSCTGHSPLCKHYSCQLTPPQYTCYYAAAHFQRLLYSTPPSPPVQVSSLPNVQTSPSLTNPLSYIYTLPVFVLIISNIALLWTIYNKETVKE